MMACRGTNWYLAALAPAWSTRMDPAMKLFSGQVYARTCFPAYYCNGDYNVDFVIAGQGVWLEGPILEYDVLAAKFLLSFNMGVPADPDGHTGISIHQVFPPLANTLSERRWTKLIGSVSPLPADTNLHEYEFRERWKVPYQINPVSHEYEYRFPPACYIVFWDEKDMLHEVWYASPVH